MPTEDDQPPGTGEAESAETKAEVADLQHQVNAFATRWLKERFGLREDADGTLHLPDTNPGDIPVKAEQFMSGFLREVVDKVAAKIEPGATPSAADVPEAGEVVVPFLSKVGSTVTAAWQAYLRQNAVDPQHPEQPVVIDGRFVRRHALPALEKITEALGVAFGEARAGAPAEPSSETREVQVKIELSKFFKSFAENFAARFKEANATKPAEPPPASAGTEPKKDEPSAE